MSSGGWDGMMWRCGGGDGDPIVFLSGAVLMMMAGDDGTLTMTMSETCRCNDRGPAVGDEPCRVPIAAAPGLGAAGLRKPHNPS